MIGEQAPVLDRNMANTPMDIEALIPHRDRMKLIEDVLEIHDESSTTSARVSPRWPLYRDAYVDPVVLIELVAQTAAVHISVRRNSQEGDRRGWMVGIKNVDFYQDRIPVDTVLVTTVKALYHIENYTVIEGEVRSGPDVMCRAQIQVLREITEETAVKKE